MKSISKLFKKEIGYVPQHTLANPNFCPRVLEIVLMGLVSKKFLVLWEKDKEKAMQALKSVGMEKFGTKPLIL